MIKMMMKKKKGRKKKTAAQLQLGERGVRPSPAAPQVTAAGGQEVLQARSTSSPVARGEAPGGAGCPPAAHGSHTEQISTLQPVEEPPVEQVDVSPS